MAVRPPVVALAAAVLAGTLGGGAGVREKPDSGE